jgi:HK97 family phage major capsid protein
MTHQVVALIHRLPDAYGQGTARSNCGTFHEGARHDQVNQLGRRAPSAFTGRNLEIHMKPKELHKSVSQAEPWNDTDDGSITFKLATIEAQKAGVVIANKSWYEMTKSELLATRNDSRRLTNQLTEKVHDLIGKDDAEADRLLKIANETSRWAARADRQLMLNEVAKAHEQEGRNSQMRSAGGKAIPILDRSQSFASLQPYDRSAEFGFGEFVAAMVRGTERGDIRNALSEGTDSAGGYTVPRVLMGDLIDRMRAKTVCIQAGALTIPLETQTTTIARIASDPTAAWRLESGAVNVADPTFEAVTFTARSLAVLVKVSRELLADSANIDQALMMAFAGAIAVEVDRVALVGSGTAPEPRGIFNTANINSVSMGANGAQLTSYGKQLDCLYELQLDNAPAPSAQVMHPRTWRTIQGFADTTGQPLQLPPGLVGLPQLVTTSIPINQTQGTATNASSIIVGDFSQLLIGVREELRIEVMRETYAGTGEYAFIAHLRMDVAVAHPESFCKLVGIIP